jgi:hypothetical protein
MAAADILNNYYSLSDHPFDPQTDQKRKLDLKARKLSLMRELKMFEHSELRNYFVKVGSFLTTSEALDKLLTDSNYNGSPVPPALLVQGTKGTGMDSMAQYAALAIRDRAPGAILRLVPIPSASKPRLLMLIKGELESFLPDGKDIFAKYDKLLDPRKPDQAFLTTLIRELTTLNIPDQPLILTIGPINWDCKDWLLWLYQLLAPLNVFLIFFSDDTRIASWFDDQIGKGLIPGLCLRLKGLNAAEGQQFVEKRFDDFRAASVTPKSFPFHPTVFPGIFKGVPEERVGVKFLIQILRNSLNAKISTLEKGYVIPPPPQKTIQIEWVDISSAYEVVLNRKAPTP